MPAAFSFEAKLHFLDFLFGSSVGSCLALADAAFFVDALLRFPSPTDGAIHSLHILDLSKGYSKADASDRIFVRSFHNPIWFDSLSDWSSLESGHTPRCGKALEGSSSALPSWLKAASRNHFERSCRSAWTELDPFLKSTRSSRWLPPPLRAEVYDLQNTVPFALFVS